MTAVSSGPFQAARLAFRALWRRPLAPLILGLFLLGWGQALSGLTAPLLRELLAAALGGEPLLGTALAIIVIWLLWNAMLPPIIGLCLAMIEAAPEQALPRALNGIGGLLTLGLLGGLAALASELCLTAAVIAAARRALDGGGAVSAALLYALPAGPSFVLGAVAGGATLLAVGRVGAGQLAARTPGEGLLALGSCGADLLRDPLRTGALFSALLIVTAPFSVLAIFMGTAGVLLRPALARAAFRLGAALCAAAALLWIIRGLRLGLEPGPRARDEAVIE